MGADTCAAEVLGANGDDVAVVDGVALTLVVAVVFVVAVGAAMVPVMVAALVFVVAVGALWQDS